MKKYDRYRFVIWAAFLLVIALMFVSGCGKTGQVNPNPDTDYVIDTMWADRTTIVAGEYTTVYIRIKGKTSGLYVKNIPVEVTTNYGSILTPEPITNNEGVASTTFMTERDSTATNIATAVSYTHLRAHET